MSRTKTEIENDIAYAREMHATWVQMVEHIHAMPKLENAEKIRDDWKAELDKYRAELAEHPQ